MASTYSALKIELLETGANSGTWGTATNVNLGDAILGEAITGQATVDFNSDADVTITLTDSSTSQAARNLRLNITESSLGVGSVRNLILGSGCQIEKFYLINNTGTGAKTIKNTSGTGISVPAGKATLVYNNGTNVVDAASYFTSLTLGSALPVASGGTGTASPALVQGANVTITGTWPNQTIAAAAPGTGTVTSVAGTGTVNGISLSGSVTTSGSLTLGGTLSGVSLTTQVTGTLPVGNGGTGITSLGTGVATFLGTPSSANLASAVTDETGSGLLVFATSPTLTTPLLGTPTSGVLSNCTVDGTDAVGFRNIPQNSQSADYTLVLTDSGKHIFHPVGDNNARTFTIPANSSVAYPIGTAITFINMAVANVTIAITTDTLTLSSAGTTGSRTLATNGSATCIKITSTSWLISGSGLT